ncbi:crotonobetainyl-CoA:carnitine CoA-transferase CaiB-like acyl-CoA transferase [Pararhizobium capsulatum DSM 1112]|uniref:Crotonobetainyl-CoA:carnitine CoA-transferase CaiB-like acyl-CoA transferase n=1 Tax=Pararhizobium capsulatum DSM 1112 TaxID=1121113 RepID=A0ABU0BZG5_9HYPH|nr:CoA transferase [Pararhizobium capsulatum]MDQ0323357.1 crotonobetainyl-CoA:carnitine CoA-transferase CaiB-like acyl-CoA transferase [Pararhizobium capsulatum DSM 1112]
MTGYSRRHWDPSAKGPLEGIKVLDLSRLVAGNMLSLQLADFGADVVKIESPSGDPLRDWKDDGHSLYWKTYSRNKRSVVLNLRRKADMDALWSLIERADVFIENFRPGTLEQMGLAPDVLHARNPDLIIVRISGFGQTGPYAQLPGFGTIVEGMSGFAYRTGFPDREPVLPPLALADMIAGVYGSSATVTALLARDRGLARGQVIDLSLLEPIFSVLGPESAIYKVTGVIKERVGSASNTAAPRNVYKCRDGKYVALSGSTPQVARRIFEIIGRADMNDDPRFATNSDRVKNRALVDEVVGGWFAEHDHDEALEIMRNAGATVGPIYNVADATRDPHFADREIIVNAEDSEFGSLPMHNIVPRLSQTPGVWRKPAPSLGEHTAEVLAEAGLESAMIEIILGEQS